MANDIDEIINNLTKAKTGYKLVTDSLGSHLESIGQQKEVVKNSLDLFENMKASGIIPPYAVTASGVAMSNSVYTQSQELSNFVNGSKLAELVNLSGSVVSYMGGVGASGATLSYPPGQLPQAWYMLDKSLNQSHYRAEIFAKLSQIDPSLATEYNNCWSDLYKTTDDPARSPMFLMREVIIRIYVHFAPDVKVRAKFNLNPTEKITRRHRVTYISTIIDQSKKNLFLAEEKAFVDIYDELSKAHARGSLNEQEAKSVLHQADGLILLLLNSM